MSNSEARKYQQLEISLASPKEIRSWSERFLPNGEIVGEVTSWETVNYKTLKPEPNGLFCQKIFGPIIDYTCACGKKGLKTNRGFCPKCGVERTLSQVRRYRLGYIRLAQPVAHTLYASQKPSPLALCLNWPNKKLQAVLYGTEFCHLSSKFEYYNDATAIYLNWKNLLKKNFFRFKFKKISKHVPLLFQSKSINYSKNFQKDIYWKILSKIYFQKKLSFNLNLYGITHDSTWRQVEDFQEFLLYLWDQSHSYELLNTYYWFVDQTPNFTNNTIPNHDQYYPIQTGGFVFQKIFSHYNLIGLQRQLLLDLNEIKKTINFLKDRSTNKGFIQSDNSKIQIEITRYKDYEKRILRRLTYFRDFSKGQTQPAWMVLSYLPVLPPGLRPITSIRGELVISDLNSLYRKVLTRNRRLINSTKFSIFDTALSGSWAAWCYNLRQVQESVDSLLKTGKVESGKVTKSLLDSLKGKRGRFRQNLLGKRVDYSGRSVIVVGPQLHIYECGLPKQMAVELFQPFLIQQLRNKGIAFTTTGAKSIISERKPIIWVLLREILQSHPVLLNRAPTLHRLGIQAFLPKLVDGKAILLHPLVCPAFNADFDGDQMAVHVPLSAAARAEAFNLLLACNHILAPSSGQPLLLPTQDMILGCYYLTLLNPKNEFQILKKYKKLSTKNKNFKLLNQIFKRKTYWYSNFDEALQDYNTRKISLHEPIWIKWQYKVQNSISDQLNPNSNLIFEIRFDIYGNKESFSSEKYIYINEITNTSTKSLKIHFIRTTIGRILFYKFINLSTILPN